MALLTLLAGLALASPPLVDLQSATADTEDLALAQQLVDAHRYDAAEALARRVAEQGTPDLAARATAILAQLPSRHSMGTNKAVLAGWHTALGAWSLGPAVALSSRRWQSSTAQVGGVALGATLGLGSSLVYTRWVEPTTSRTLLLMGTEQVVMWHGAALSLLVDPTGMGVAPGMQIGAAVGLVGGGLLSVYVDVEPGPLVAAYSGIGWGLGLTAAWTLASSEGEVETDELALTLLVGSDVGMLALGGLGLALELSPAEAGLMNVGGLLGGGLAGTGLGMALLYSDHPEDYSPLAGVGWVTAGVVAGAAAALVFTRKEGAPDLGLEVETAPVLLPGPDGKMNAGMGLSGRF